MAKKVISESRRMAMEMCPMNKIPYKKGGRFISKHGQPLCRRKPKKGPRKMAHAMAMPMAHAMPTMYYNPHLPLAPAMRLR